LALFAVALQLVLAFGHVHVGATATEPSLLAFVAPNHADDGTKPQHRNSHHPADDLCAICLVSSLIGSAQVAAPPIVLPPSIHATAIPLFLPDASRAEQLRVAFRSRAPPQA
jgi:hypothetical protein